MLRQKQLVRSTVPAYIGILGSLKSFAGKLGLVESVTN